MQFAPLELQDSHAGQIRIVAHEQSMGSITWTETRIASSHGRNHSVRLAAPCCPRSESQTEGDTGGRLAFHACPRDGCGTMSAWPRNNLMT